MIGRMLFSSPFSGMVILVAFKTDADLIDNVNELNRLAIQVVLKKTPISQAKYYSKRNF
jgi:hypothetical protein